MKLSKIAPTSLLAAIGVVFASAFAVSAAPLPLFENGRTDWVAVLPEGADCILSRAANEFADTVERVSGARIPIVGERPAEGPAILFTTFADGSDDEHLLARLVDDTTFEISGNSSRATLHTALRFLKEQLGVRWLWYGEDGAFYPQRTAWSFPAGFTYAYTPPIRYRGWHTCGAWRGIDEFREWMGRNCLNSQRHTLVSNSAKDKWISWGLIPMYSDHSAHVDRALIDEHPDWFSLLGDRRTTEAICYTSEGARQFVAQKMATYLDGHPETEILSFFPEDNLDYCQCAECQKRSVSDNWFAFFNAVVAKLRPQYPKVKFATLAYQGYRSPPTDSDNLPKDCEFVEVCTHGRCNVHLFSDGETCEKNAKDLAYYKAWAETGVPMGTYAYEFNLFTTPKLTPFFSFAEDTVKTAFRYAPRAFIPEIVLSPTAGPDTMAHVPVNRLPVQFYTDLMWDPSLTFDRWLDDIAPYVFGAAEDEMKAYLKVLDRAWYSQEACSGYYKNPLVFLDTFFTPETAAAAEAALQVAEAKIAATDDARSQANVRRERVLLNQWKDLRLTQEGKLHTVNVLPAGERPGAINGNQPALDLVKEDGSKSGVTMRLGWVTVTKSNKHDGKPWPTALLVRLAGVGAGRATSVAVCNEDGGTDRVYGEPTRVEGDEVYYDIPFDDFGEMFDGSSVWYLRATVALADGSTAVCPAGEKDHLYIRRSDLSATGRPFLYMNGYGTPEKDRATVITGGETLGWDVTYCTAAPQLAAADIENIPVLWFSNVGYLKGEDAITDALWRRVANAVENGAIALFGAYYSVKTARIFGEEYSSTETASIGSVPVGNKVADYLAPGNWNKSPNNFSTHKPESLCYSQTPTDPTGWTILFTVKNNAGESVPYISYKQYGDGAVFLVGEGFGINRYKFGENILANKAELGIGGKAYESGIFVSQKTDAFGKPYFRGAPADEPVYTNLADAVAAAANGDTIWVEDGFLCDSGTASTHGNNRILVTKELTIRSRSGRWEKGAEIRGAWNSEATPIGANQVRAIAIGHGGALTMVGFRLTHGSISGSGDCTAGGAVKTCGLSSHIGPSRFENCLFADNYGTVAYTQKEVPMTLVDCVFSNNHATCAHNCSAYNCLFDGASGPMNGAISVGDNPCIVSNCIVRNNTSTSSNSGAGIFCSTPDRLWVYDTVVTNNAITHNVGNGAGARGYGYYERCDISMNTAPNAGSAGATATVANGIVLVDCFLTNNVSKGQVGCARDICATNTLFANNESTGNFCGGVYNGTLYKCRILDNRAKEGNGGGVRKGYCERCLIAGNVCTNTNPNGGGAYEATLVDCIVTNNIAKNGGGTRDCVVVHCLVADNWALGGGGGTYNGTVSNSVIRGNFAGASRTADEKTGNGGGAYGGTLVRCVVSNNVCIYRGAGTCDASTYNCLIAGNVQSGSLPKAGSVTCGGGAGVWNGTEHVNDLIVRNEANSEYGGPVGVYSATPAFVNCTITDNSSKGVYCYNVCGGRSAVLVNTVACGNAQLGPSTLPDAFKAVTNSFVAADASSVGGFVDPFKGVDPRLGTVEGFAYTPLGSSKCKNNALEFPWMRDANDIRSKDVYGHDRIMGSAPDIGAVERKGYGLQMLVK